MKEYIWVCMTCHNTTIEKNETCNICGDTDIYMFEDSYDEETEKYVEQSEDYDFNL